MYESEELCTAVSQSCFGESHMYIEPIYMASYVQEKMLNHNKMQKYIVYNFQDFISNNSDTINSGI